MPNIFVAVVEHPVGGHLRREPGHRPATRARASREARPERVAQRAARQREAERGVLVHRVGDEAEAAVGVEEGEGGGGQRVRHHHIARAAWRLARAAGDGRTGAEAGVPRRAGPVTR